MILDIVHSFINIFAGGRSDIRVYLFALYLIFFIILYFFIKNYASIKNWKWLSINLIITYIYGIFLHIFYVLKNNLSLTDFIITGNNSEISSSILWHTHIAKGILGQIFYFFGKNNLQTMDAGGAYINLVPSTLFLIGLLLTTTLAIQVILYFVTSFRILMTNKNKRQKIALIMGYIVISFSLIKTSIDGGLFNQSFWISIIFIYLYILSLKNKLFINYYYILSIVGMILIYISVYIISLYIASIATILLFYTLILYMTEKKIDLKILIPILIIFLSGWWLASARDRDIYTYSNTILNNEQEVNVYNKKSKEVETLKIKQTQKVKQLAKELNKNITYMPIAIPYVTCMPKSTYEKYSIRIISTKPIYENTFIKNKYLEIKNKDSIYNNKNWETTLDIYTDPCLPEPLSVIDGELSKNNIFTYILVNPISYDAFNN